jgi:hypothetical protein
MNEGDNLLSSYTEHCKSCGRPLFFTKKKEIKIGDEIFFYDYCIWCGTRAVKRDDVII